MYNPYIPYKTHIRLMASPGIFFHRPLKEIFGVIRALNPFRLTGASRDYIVASALLWGFWGCCFDWKLNCPLVNIQKTMENHNF